MAEAESGTRQRPSFKRTGARVLAGGRDDCLLDVTQDRRARAAASTGLLTSSSLSENVEEVDACLLVADDQLVPISPLDRPQASSAAASWSRA